MRNVKGGHLFVLGLLLVGAIGTSLIIDMPVPTENADASIRHECECIRTSQVWVETEDWDQNTGDTTGATTLGEIKSGDTTSVGGYYETRCDEHRTAWHYWKFWNHRNGRPCY